MNVGLLIHDGGRLKRRSDEQQELELDASTDPFKVHCKTLHTEGVYEMLYTIVFVSRHTRSLSATDAMTAREALALAEALQSQYAEIKYITSPQEGEFGVEMLRLLAKEEGEEMPFAPTAAANQDRSFQSVVTPSGREPC